MTVYVDESGNTGSRVFDEQQPIYSCAAVWVKSETESKLLEEVQTLSQSHNIIDQMLGGSSGELKGSSLCGSGSGRNALIELSRCCAKLDIPVSLIAQHKHFMGASVVVEDGLDPMYNPKVSQNWYNDAAQKEATAQLIHDEVDKALLQTWWEARLKGSCEDFESANHKLADKLVESNTERSNSLGETLKHFDVQEFWETIVEVRDDSIPDFSPNSTSFSYLLQLINDYSDEFGEGVSDIVHDEQAEFEEEYKFYENTMPDRKSAEIILTNGNKISVGIPKVGEVEFRDSTSSIPLQVADCFAAIARTVIEDYTLGEEIDDRFYDILSQCNQTCTQKAGRSSIYVIGPQNWQGGALRSLAGDSAIRSEG